MKFLSLAYSVVLLLPNQCVSYPQDTAKVDLSAVQHLLAQLASEDDSVRFEALQALAKLGQGVIPAVGERLKADGGYAQVYAARVLLTIEPQSQPALIALSGIARNKQEKKEVRRYSCYVMALSASGINIVAAMLKDEDVFVRRSAAFALEELIENGTFLPPALVRASYDSLPAVASALADTDKTVSGLAAEVFMQVYNEYLPALDEAARSSNTRLRNAATEVLERRKNGYRPDTVEAEAKPGFEESADKSPTLLHGNLGLIRALRMGGEPVRDYRSIIDENNPRSLHIILKPSTRKMSMRMNDFNPYQDLR